MLKKSMIAMILLAVVAFSGSAFAGSAWYEDYQRVQNWIEDGKIDDASSLLDTLIAKYPEPEADVRIPGDRFINYLPFYHRARIELARQDYVAASRSLQISQAFGATLRDRAVTSDLLRMQDLLKTNTMQSDAMALSTPAKKNDQPR